MARELVRYDIVHHFLVNTGTESLFCCLQSERIRQSLALKCFPRDFAGFVNFDHHLDYTRTATITHTQSEPHKMLTIFNIPTLKRIRRTLSSFFPSDYWLNITMTKHNFELKCTINESVIRIKYWWFEILHRYTTSIRENFTLQPQISQYCTAIRQTATTAVASY